jgi:hypothetical protein
MQKRTIEISGEVEVAYDENSPTFKESLECWNDLISDGDAEDMVLHVVSQLRSWGDHEHMIEGVGYVGLIGQPVPAKGYCGIQISPRYGQLEHEFN